MDVAMSGRVFTLAQLVRVATTYEQGRRETDAADTMVLGKQEDCAKNTRRACKFSDAAKTGCIPWELLVTISRTRKICGRNRRNYSDTMVLLIGDQEKNLAYQWPCKGRGTASLDTLQ
jgi:hypothetical protein